MPSSSGALFRAGVELIRVLLKVQYWKSRHSLAKQHEHFARGFGYATNIDGDIHLRLAVLLTLTVQWLTQ